MNTKRIPIKISEIIQELKLPQDTLFLGFIVHLPDTDEFLTMASYQDDLESRLWSKIPDLAKIYKDQEEAEKEANRYGKGATAVILFDTGNEFFVTGE